MKITTDVEQAFDPVLVDSRSGYAPRPVMSSFLAAAVSCGDKPDHWILRSDVSGEDSTWDIVALVNGFIIHTTGHAEQSDWTFSQFDQNLPRNVPADHPENTTVTDIWPANRVRQVRVSSAEHLEGWPRTEISEIAVGWDLILDDDRTIEIRPRNEGDRKAGDDLVRAVLASAR